MSCLLFCFTEDKRRIYDVQGKAGLSNNGGSSSHQHSDPFAHFNGGGGAHHFFFRDPMDIFAEFFGDSHPFNDFMGMSNISLLNSFIVIFRRTSSICPVYL